VPFLHCHDGPQQGSHGLCAPENVTTTVHQAGIAARGKAGDDTVHTNVIVMDACVLAKQNVASCLGVDGGVKVKESFFWAMVADHGTVNVTRVFSREKVTLPCGSETWIAPLQAELVDDHGEGRVTC